MTELPLSLSIVTAEKMTVKMLEKGTPLPASKTRIFTAPNPLPGAIMIELVTGERFAAADNRRITRIRIGGIKKTVGDVARIAVKLEVANDGTISLEAFDYGSHHKKKKMIGSDWLPTEEEVRAAVAEAEEYAEQETLLRDRNRLLSRAKATALSVRSVSRTDRENITAEEWSDLKEKAGELRSRIKKARAEDITDLDAKVITEQMKSIQNTLKKL